MAEKRHPGITMHKLSFGGGIEGLTFAIGSALIFLFGLPSLWYFVVLAFVLGVGIAVFLRTTSDRRAERNKPLSICSPANQSPVAGRPLRKKDRQLFQIYPRLSST